MIDVIAEAEGISLSSMQFKAMVGKGNILTKDCLNFKLKPGMVPLLDLVGTKLSSFYHNQTFFLKFCIFL